MGNLKIAISGELGSGKTVLSSKLSQTLGMEIISVGKIQRELAMKYGMTVLEFNKYMETHPEIDHECDDMVTRYGLENRPLILDSRLAWHFVPHSFKIHLLVDTATATNRIFNDKARKNEVFATTDEARQQIIDRKSSETLRFKQQYGLDINRFDNYNLVLDTSHATPDRIFSVVLNSIREWENDETLKRVLFCPQSLLPLNGIKRNGNDDSNYRHNDLVYNTPPIPIIAHVGRFYIFNNHKNVSAALMFGYNFIPCRPLNHNEILALPNQDITDYLRKNYSLKLVQDWESLHGFKFSDYQKSI